MTFDLFYELPIDNYDQIWQASDVQAQQGGTYARDLGSNHSNGSNMF